MRDHVRFLVRLIIFGIVFTILCKSGIGYLRLYSHIWYDMGGEPAGSILSGLAVRGD